MSNTYLLVIKGIHFFAGGSIKMSTFFSRVILCFASLFMLWLTAAGAAYAAVGPGNVKVGLAIQADTIGFKTSGAYHLVEQSTGKEITRLEQGEQWQVRVENGQIMLEGRKERLGPFAGPVTVSELDLSFNVLSGTGQAVESSSSGHFFVLNGEGELSPFNSIDNPYAASSQKKTALTAAGDGLNLVSLISGAASARYRGSLEFRVENGKLAVVNELNIEDYLRGVVPAEIPPSWPKEALKAQAVAARNYALQQVEVSRGSKYNLLDDQLSQVYRGYDAETPATNEAVEETRGMVMTSQGRLITAFFHACSGGFTENSEDVWLEQLPYIKGKADPYDKNDKHYDWQVDYTVEQLVAKLQGSGYNLAVLEDIEELARTSSGARIKSIAVSGQGTSGEPVRIVISNADKVRNALGLKSSLFTLEKVYDQEGILQGIKICGSGNGHGLGMSQWGARGMAAQGYNYQEILKYYYTGVEITGDYGRSASR
ncbi:MAG TPA: SpoIID/LytB domain-containing protein [Bacillota bacterium]|nr:SpoIID/LytB domain-containing protein [Peptococcaceae bacterium MAG4]NLW37125.1 SpoIID/LytB domain-containing protein [Peptococcaceae bacterium]HPU36141.1 SpoIID/LytB domain-containing protein [Bacillota bacterium]HPZ44179.1 SpoIID/LytB domain-containing protein [Bacillota bacterium]HQD76795.1 SpoIID/LytB domain-containing protein [Bacillota bacterium]